MCRGSPTHSLLRRHAARPADEHAYGPEEFVRAEVEEKMPKATTIVP